MRRTHQPPAHGGVLRAIGVVALVVGAGTAAGCGDDDGDQARGEERAEQVRTAAVGAGLPEEVADVLALAARGTTATYRVTYAGTEGAAIIWSQEPPNHRIDIVAGEVVVESRVLRNGISYRCTAGSPPAADDPLDCRRDDAAVELPGAFSDEALADFTTALAGSTDRFDLTVEERTIAGTTATCLVTAPKAGSPIDGTGPGVDTLCLSPEGAQLLTDSEGERVVADTYSTEVPEGTFDV